MLRLEKVATPATAALGLVPVRMPPEGLVPIARVMLVFVVTRFPPASRTSTCTAGVIDAPLAVFEGCTRKPSFVAGPTVMLKGLEVAAVRPVALAVSV